MSCTRKNVLAIYSEPKNGDPSCGCQKWGHYVDGEPCHHESTCAAHELIRLLNLQVYGPGYLAGAVGCAQQDTE